MVEDCSGNELPVIPWLEVKNELSGLDKAGEVYLGYLWAENVQAAIDRSILIKELRDSLSVLDEATEIYLVYYWADKVQEAKAI